MMQNGLKIGGAIVFWSLGEYFYRSLLLERWTATGFERFVPAPRPHTAALRDALQQVVGGPRRLIRPLKKRDGFTVKDEVLGEDDNDYTHYLVAKVASRPEDEKVRIALDPLRAEEANRIVEQFNRYSGYLTRDQVASGLVALMLSLSATTLRPSGGLYWVPDFAVPHAAAAGAVVEECGASGRSALYVMRNVMDADACRAVRDAISAEVTAEIERLDGEVLGGALGERALQSRKDQVAELRLKVKEYEAILGEGLGALVQATQQTEEIICKAEVLQSLAAEVGA
jgi:hypothetical protein